jgi:hypothetical protein
MAIEIGPFCLTCSDCDEEIPISRHTARSPESMTLYQERITQSHRCKRTPAPPNNLDDRWTDLLTRVKTELRIH